MSYETEFDEFMPHTVTIEPWQSQDSYGKPVFGAAVEYRARVANVVRRVRAFDGEERVSSTSIWIGGGDHQISVRDRITLPSQFETPLLPIIRVDRLPDEDGGHHVKIYA